MQTINTKRFAQKRSHFNSNVACAMREVKIFRKRTSIVFQLFRVAWVRGERGRPKGLMDKMCSVVKRVKGLKAPSFFSREFVVYAVILNLLKLCTTGGNIKSSRYFFLQFSFDIVVIQFY